MTDKKPEELDSESLEKVQGGITLDNGLKGKVRNLQGDTNKPLSPNTGNITLDNGIKRS